MLIYQFALFSVTGAGINLFSACGYVSQSFRICSLFKQFYFLELVRKIEISFSDPREPDCHLKSRAPLRCGFQSEFQVIRHLL